MPKCWIQLITGSLVIFFAGRKYPLYADFFISQIKIKSPFLRTITCHILHALPEFCVILSTISIIKQPDVGLGTVLGATLFNFVIIGGILLKNREKDKDFLSVLFIITFLSLLAFSLGLKISLGFLKVGLASMVMLAGYVMYIKLFPVSETLESPKLEITHSVAYVRFILATFLIFIGAGQVVYAAKVMLKYVPSSYLIGSFLLAPIACCPKLSSLWSKGKPVFDLKMILETNILVLGLLGFLIDFFYYPSVIFGHTNYNLFYLALEGLLLSFLYLGTIKWFTYQKFLSSIMLLVYIGSVLCFISLR